MPPKNRNESLSSIIDDPAKTTLTITGGALIAFTVLHEMVPPGCQDLVKVLAGADFLLNVATWKIIRNNQLDPIEP